MRKRIRTFNDLKVQQERLRVQADISKDLFYKSIGNTRRNLTDFLVKGVLLPAGAAGAATWGAKKLFGENGEEERQTFQTGNSEDYSENFTSSLVSKLMPIGLSLLNAYIAKQFVEEEVEQSV